MKYGLSLTKQIYEKYFRVQAHGVENIPAEGPVLERSDVGGRMDAALGRDGQPVGVVVAASRDSTMLDAAAREEAEVLKRMLGETVGSFAVPVHFLGGDI